MAGQGGPAEIGDATFDKFIKDNRLAAVDFWAPWCGPCKTMAPNFEALAKQYAGRVAFGKVNVDKNPVTPSKFGIRGIPTIILFKDGRVAHQIVGLVPKEKLAADIDEHLL